MFYDILFRAILVGMIAIIGMMLIRVFAGPSVYDRLNGIFAIGTDVIIVLLLIGAITNREDMYVDIAFSYGLLGFLSTVIIARFLGNSKSKTKKFEENEKGESDG